MKYLGKPVFVLLILIYSYNLSFPAVQKNKLPTNPSIIDSLCITIGTYGLGVKVDLASVLNTEIRYNLDNEVKIYSARAVYKIRRKGMKNLVPYVGAEYGMIDFNSEGIVGKGSLVNGYLGIELLINPKITFGFDVVYDYFTLTAGKESISGPEWRVNSGINLYLFKK